MAKITSLPNVIKYLKIINFRLSFLKGWLFSDTSDFCQSCMKKSAKKSSLRCNFFNLGILFLLFIFNYFILTKLKCGERADHRPPFPLFPLEKGESMIETDRAKFRALPPGGEGGGEGRPLGALSL